MIKDHLPRTCKRIGSRPFCGSSCAFVSKLFVQAATEDQSLEVTTNKLAINTSKDAVDAVFLGANHVVDAGDTKRYLLLESVETNHVLS